MEVERALLDGEQEAEVTQLQSDKEMLEQLNQKMGNMEKNAQRNQTRVTICWPYVYVFVQLEKIENSISKPQDEVSKKANKRVSFIYRT